MAESEPTIVLLGGTYGVGKTTTAHYLGAELSIMQRTGLGGITKTIKTLMPESDVVRDWHRYDHGDRAQVRDKLLRESELIGRVITGIVEAACASGENYIIDGVQLLPEFLPLDKVQLFTLTCTDKAEHRKRFECPTITRARHNTVSSYELASTVESILLEESGAYRIPLVNNTSAPQVTAKLIGALVRAHGGAG